MRAFVVTAPRELAVLELPDPVPAEGEALIEVARVGVCGTDVELWAGEMAYVEQGLATYPLQLGHEWSGQVVDVAPGADRSWIGRRVTGDTMIGEGTCRRCRRGLQHVCAERVEAGLYGRAGALAELTALPLSSLHVLPHTVDDAAGALVEPGGNAWRAAHATNAAVGDRVLVMGPGTIGSLVAMFLRPSGAEIHLMGRSEEDLAFARSLGFEHCWVEGALPELPFDAVVDASNGPHIPALALDVVEPGGRVVYIGLAGAASLIDTRTMALKDVTSVGILSASPGLADTISAYASGAVDPRPLIGATVGLDEVGDVLAGRVRPPTGRGPKVLVDPRGAR
jgi:threonine dehydrogenase-like Zn-dependent dehydrogenase